MRNVEVIPAIIMALGTVTKHFEKWIDKLDLDQTSEALHKLCLLGTTRIIRKVLDMKSEKKKKKETTISKKTVWCLLLCNFLLGNNIRPERKRNNNNNNNSNN